MRVRVRVRVRVRARHRVRAGRLCLAALPEREVLQPLELRVEQAEMLACLTLTLTRSLPNPTPNPVPNPMPDPSPSPSPTPNLWVEQAEQPSLRHAVDPDQVCELVGAWRED